MAKQVWQSNSGRVFQSKAEAEKDDVYCDLLTTAILSCIYILPILLWLNPFELYFVTMAVLIIN